MMRKGLLIEYGIKFLLVILVLVIVAILVEGDRGNSVLTLRDKVLVRK